MTAGAYVGRVGALAVTFGIGTATAAGVCASCAYADSGDSTAGRSGNSSSSQSVSPGPRRGTRIEAPASTIDIAPDVAVPQAAAARHSAVQPQLTESKRSGIRMPAEVALPDAEMAPSAAPQQEGAAMPSLAAQNVTIATDNTASQAVETTPEPASVMSTAPVKSAAVSSVAQSLNVPVAPLPQPAVVIASPPAGQIEAVVTGVVSSLSSALGGGAPTVPADTSLAVMLGLARRSGWGPVVKVAAATATTTAAAAATSSTTTTTTIEAESMALSGPVRVVSDRYASGGSALAMTGAATASTTVNLPASTGLTIRAKASSGSPNMTLSLDGQAVTTVVVSSTGWSDYTITGSIPAGSHVIGVSTSNATALSSLSIDRLTTMTGPMVIDFTGRSGALPNNVFWTSKSGTGWDGGVENYTSANTYLDGKGNLVIKAARTSSGGYTSGWVESKNKVSFGYGTVTARIKVPKGQGLWPAFWLKGADEDTTAWPTSGEIDVMELPSTTTTMYSTLHGPIAGTTATQQAQVISNLPDLSTDYHNYWVRHLPDEITFGIDGQTLGTLTPDSLPAGATWVYNRPMQVILNMAVGGSWAGAPDSTTPFPSTMSVDWVRWDPPA